MCVVLVIDRYPCHCDNIGTAYGTCMGRVHLCSIDTRPADYLILTVCLLSHSRKYMPYSHVLYLAMPILIALDKPYPPLDALPAQSLATVSIRQSYRSVTE